MAFDFLKRLFGRSAAAPAAENLVPVETLLEDAAKAIENKYEHRLYKALVALEPRLSTDEEKQAFDLALKKYTELVDKDDPVLVLRKYLGVLGSLPAESKIAQAAIFKLPDALEAAVASRGPDVLEEITTGRRADLGGDPLRYLIARLKTDEPKAVICAFLLNRAKSLLQKEDEKGPNAWRAQSALESVIEIAPKGSTFRDEAYNALFDTYQALENSRPGSSTASINLAYILPGTAKAPESFRQRAADILIQSAQKLEDTNPGEATEIYKTLYDYVPARKMAAWVGLLRTYPKFIQHDPASALHPLNQLAKTLSAGSDTKAVITEFYKTACKTLTAKDPHEAVSRLSSDTYTSAFKTIAAKAFEEALAALQAQDPEKAGEQAVYILDCDRDKNIWAACKPLFYAYVESELAKNPANARNTSQRFFDHKDSEVRAFAQRSYKLALAKLQPMTPQAFVKKFG